MALCNGFLFFVDEGTGGLDAMSPNSFKSSTGLCGFFLLNLAAASRLMLSLTESSSLAKAVRLAMLAYVWSVPSTSLVLSDCCCCCCSSTFVRSLSPSPATLIFYCIIIFSNLCDKGNYCTRLGWPRSNLGENYEGESINMVKEIHLDGHIRSLWLNIMNN